MTKLQIFNHARKLVRDFLDKPSDLPKIVVILGATASGKTWLSIELAKLFDGEIISADSRQVWQDFDIGTAKVTEEEAQGVPHHLINVVTADQEFTLWDWKTRTEEIIKDLSAKKKLPLIAGGTGLYVDALVDNYHIPKRDPELRKKLEKEWQKDQGQTLWKKLNEIDPNTAAQFLPESYHHLVRATEVAMLNQDKKKGPKKFDSLLIGLRWPREIRTERIEQRTDIQFKDGLENEVKDLLRKYDPTLPAMTGIGYREVITYLQGKITLEEARNQVIHDTKKYAKRQDTWWRRRSDVLWIDCG